MFNLVRDPVDSPQLIAGVALAATRARRWFDG
jgi:hypothetical protein